MALLRGWEERFGGIDHVSGVAAAAVSKVGDDSLTRERGRLEKGRDDVNIVGSILGECSNLVLVDLLGEAKTLEAVEIAKRWTEEEDLRSNQF